ncbi:class I SAM-dependent methyltransferase [Agromyces sp. LHK192]|uniref:class I SAM-dependent methyltransferase n=1 Tax=Agromyces sp. LHK192 TaxID=2498704 RepID=UPI0013E37A08|nr:class I SAM-dependent methyltransferase [Agromyces sp. LHK192]
MGEAILGDDRMRHFVHDSDRFAALDAEIWEPISLATVLRSAPQVGELVLDACCGSGASAVPTAELVGIEGLVDAVDLAEPMLGHARSRADAFGAADGLLPQLRFHADDASTWETVGYDLVQCVLGVFFFDDVDAGARHLASRARPGGRLVLTIWAPSAFDEFEQALYAAVEAEGGEAGAAAVDRHRSHRAARKVPDSAGGLAHWMHTIGLVDVRGEEVPRHVDLDDDLAWRIVLGTSRSRVIADLDDETRERVRVRLLDTLATRGIDRVDLTVLIGVGHRPAEDAPADEPARETAVAVAEPATDVAIAIAEPDAEVATTETDAAAAPRADSESESGPDSEGEPGPDLDPEASAPVEPDAKAAKKEKKAKRKEERKRRRERDEDEAETETEVEDEAEDEAAPETT